MAAKAPPPPLPAPSYGTGGFAYGRINESVALNSTAGTGLQNGVFGFLCAAGINCFLGSSSRTATGWTAGGGLEYALWKNLSVKVEYLYVNLGGGDAITVVAQRSAPLLPSSFTAAYSSTEFNVVRAGLNYTFN